MEIYFNFKCRKLVCKMLKNKNFDKNFQNGDNSKIKTLKYKIK